MKKLLPLMLVSAFALAACGPSAAKLNNQGNEAFQNQDFEAALAAYQQAQADSPELAEPHYNAANAHYRQGAYEPALQEIEQTLIKDEGDLTQHSLYNLGNTFFQGEQYQQAIEAYKEALRLNPDDVEAKQNLELALRQLQQQQQEQQQQEQQEQQQEQNEQQDQQQEQNEQQDQQQNDQQQNNDQQDQQQDEQQQDQGQDGEQQQDQQQNDQQQDEQQGEQEQEEPQQDDGQQDDQGQDDQQGEQQPSDGQPDDQQQQGQPNGQPQVVRGLTEEQARQLLEAAAQDTESLEEHLQQIMVAPDAPPTEDW